MQRMLAQVAGRPDEFLVTLALAGTQQFSGRYKQAAATVQQAFEQAGHAKAPDVQAAILLTNAAARGLADLCAGSDAVVQQALALDRSKQTQELAVLAGAVCGGGKQALPLAQELSAKYPEDTLDPGCVSAVGQGLCRPGRGPVRAKRSMMPARLSHMT